LKRRGRSTGFLRHVLQHSSAIRAKWVKKWFALGHSGARDLNTQIVRSSTPKKSMTRLWSQGWSAGTARSRVPVASTLKRATMDCGNKIAFYSRSEIWRPHLTRARECPSSGLSMVLSHAYAARLRGPGGEFSSSLSILGFSGPWVSRSGLLRALCYRNSWRLFAFTKPNLQFTRCRGESSSAFS
jgi:hypothetical protein